VPASALSWQLTWTTPNGALVAVEPRPDEVARHAAVLAAAYNDPHNAPLLGHTEPIDAAGVIAHYADVAAGGGHNFLVYGDGSFIFENRVKGKLNVVSPNAFNYATASVLAANGLDTNSTACLAFTEANKGVNGQIDGTIEKLNAIAASQKIDLTTDDAVARVTAIYQQTQFATTSTLGLSDAQVKYNDAASTAKDKVDAYKMSLDALAGTHLTAAAAETSYSANSVSLLTTLTANKAIANGVTDASTASSLAQTKAINDNDKAIQDNVKSAMDLANAKYAETGSVDQATASLTTNRQALIDTMVQTGYTREEAEKYIDRLGLTPDNINTQVNLDAGEAKTDLTTVNEKLVTAGYGADGKVNIDTRKAEENLSGLERALKKIGDIGSGVINSFGDLFGGGREAGGPVAGGTAYLVGESGPELFMAGRSGTILSNAATRAALGGSGTTINVSVVHSGLGVDSPQLQREVVEVIRRYTARNGPVLVGASP